MRVSMSETAGAPGTGTQSLPLLGPDGCKRDAIRYVILLYYYNPLCIALFARCERHRLSKGEYVCAM
eukprot:4883217-Heterocapsa_arctica.AAC.1